MKNMSGFATYGVLLILALISLGTIGYGIQSRIKEYLYYNELSKQKIAEVANVMVCAGPNNMTCLNTQKCMVVKKTKNAYGLCQTVN